jgi:hypothetical protein
MSTCRAARRRELRTLTNALKKRVEEKDFIEVAREFLEERGGRPNPNPRGDSPGHEFTSTLPRGTGLRLLCPNAQTNHGDLETDGKH